jgi:ubiquinone/menaquinone biosynthesis C-methylase UbiE
MKERTLQQATESTEMGNASSTIAVQQRVNCPLCGGIRSSPSWVLNSYPTDRCRDCGFIYVNPRPCDDALDHIYQDRDEDGVIAFYERMATPGVLACYERKLSLLERMLPGRGRLLDFGCAAALVVEAAAKRGWEAHGVDLGSWALKAAAARGVSNIHIGRLADLGFPDGHFDVVYAAQVLEHIPSPLDELAEMRRVLKPGGLLYLEVPNNRTLPILLGLDDFELNLPPQHLNYFTPATLRLLFGRAGFQVEVIGSEGGLKWENLIGKPIRSDIAAAARHGTQGAPAANRSAPSGASRLGKQVMLSLVRRPLYYWAKVGINLFGIGRLT